MQQDTIQTMASTSASLALLALPHIRYLMSAGLVLSGSTLLLNLEAVRTVSHHITPLILRNLVRSVLPVNTLHQRHRNVSLVIQDQQ